ncbi:MAG: LysR family transcriptional regulator [Marinosulfonomonas sp.]
MTEQSGRITLWGIEVFVATAEDQSISAAARRLGVSPSSVSQQLSNLETAVGAVLLNRRERPVTLTPAGDVFRKRAQNVLNEALLAKSELARMDKQSLTQLRIGVIEDFDAGVTPALLGQLATELTSTQFLLETGPSHRLFDQLDARALDIAVAADLGAPAKWADVYPLMEEPFVAVAPIGTAARQDAQEALLAMPLIRYTTRHHMGRMLADHLARQHLTLEQRFELDSYHAIMAMVARGVGWTILTPLGVTHAKRFRDQIDVMPLPFAPLARRISLSARKDALGDMPEFIAGRLKTLLQDRIVKPSVDRLPWLQDQLFVT